MAVRQLHLRMEQAQVLGIFEHKARPNEEPITEAVHRGRLKVKQRAGPLIIDTPHVARKCAHVATSLDYPWKPARITSASRCTRRGLLDIQPCLVKYPQLKDKGLL